jgi:hypothetical protein
VQPWLLFFCSRAPAGVDCVRPWEQEVLPSCTPSSFALSSFRFHLKQPHCSMCMKRLRTDEIDTVPAPSSRLSVQRSVAVSNRQDECVAGCLCAWQPSEIDWHALEITPVSPIYWLAPGSPWVSQQRHSFQPTATDSTSTKARRALGSAARGRIAAEIADAADICCGIDHPITPAHSQSRRPRLPSTQSWHRTHWWGKGEQLQRRAFPDRRSSTPLPRIANDTPAPQLALASSAR